MIQCYLEKTANNFASRPDLQEGAELRQLGANLYLGNYHLSYKSDLHCVADKRADRRCTGMPHYGTCNGYRPNVQEGRFEDQSGSSHDLQKMKLLCVIH